eukprot:6643951-Lingulodinium_polyedra.AAC.1
MGADEELESFNGVLRSPGPGWERVPQTREDVADHEDMLAALNAPHQIAGGSDVICSETLAPPNGFNPKGTCTPRRRIMLATLAGDAMRVLGDT